MRIVDKRVREGRLYLKKGTVVDVHPGATGDVAVEGTGDVLRVRPAVASGQGWGAGLQWAGHV